MEKLRVSVLVSGNGSNLQAIIDEVNSGKLENVKIVQVISSKEDAYALERARENDIPALAVTKHEYDDLRDRMDAITKHLDGEHTDLVVLAGYLSIIPEKVIKKYEGRIINIHPALLPKHGGKECYGMKVHRKVIEAGETESGAT
ncbi:MAG: formyltransferase family protein, partial [Anaerovoracaceae bacterium]